VAEEFKCASDSRPSEINVVFWISQTYRSRTLIRLRGAQLVRVNLPPKILPTAFDLSASLIPGFFFEISLAVGNPDLVRCLLDRIQRAHVIGDYVLIVLAIMVAFILGSGFMLWVTPTVRTILKWLYQLQRSLKRWISRIVLLPFLGRLLLKPAFRKPVLSRFHRRLVELVYGETALLRNISRGFRLVGETLIMQKYKIEPNSLTNTDWGLWYAVLVEPPTVERRGNAFALALHASGWAGLSATYFAPDLRQTFYLAFVCLLIFSGLAYDWFILRYQLNPVFAGARKIRWALEELAEIKRPAKSDDAPSVELG
jgi:hypothetical protein